jgi:tetratricopeptide (TPR) repeat protein/SAM-dependent methyltransferase
MNRKERRAAHKQGKGFGGLSGGASRTPTSANFAVAAEYFRAGRLADAERHCREALSADPSHADSLHLLGMIAFQVGRHAVAIELLGKALASNGRSAECHFNLAQILRAADRLDEAAFHLTQATVLKRDDAAAYIGLGDVLMQQNKVDEAGARYQQALVLDPRAAGAHYGLANVLMQHGELDGAVKHYRRVLALKPDFAEACNNLGIALAAQGQWEEAAVHYQRALALKPQLLDVYRNLARVATATGRMADAVTLARRALAVQETEEGKVFFAQCVAHLPPVLVDTDVRELITRALLEGWGRPGELAGLAIEVVTATEVLAVCIARAAEAWPRRVPARELWSENELTAIAGDRLLIALLESALVPNIALERFLTAARQALLETAAGANAADPVDDNALALFCALAQQCFINEYVFAAGHEENRQVVDLRDCLDAALRSGAVIPTLWPVAVGAYQPLHSLALAETLFERTWPEPVCRLLVQQVREPQAERHFRAAIPALTPVENETSRQVRQQYEDMPYPRWVKTAAVGRPVTLEQFLRSQFPLAPVRRLDRRGQLDVLVAGCGTGQHPIETARRFTGCQVLAVDLSRTSLSYARRKTAELGLTNIDYAQADILELGSLGRSFDLIEASGVLHHLRDPWQGWRVLLSLLRPGGFMNVGLYSALARDDVRAARAYIAEHGFGQSADDIRQCRQELMTFDVGTPLRNVAKYSDLFSTSECRDLLFHVQEHQLTIPEIKAFLAGNNLTFLGFMGPVGRAYGQRFPADKAMADLDRWHAFETENPKAFVNMYQFWIQKPVVVPH